MTDEAPPPLCPLPGDLVDALADRLVVAVAGALSLPPEMVAQRASEAIAGVLREHARGIEERFRRAERLAILGRLSASVAHDLRNPLSVIETSAFILSETGSTDERVVRHARRIAEQVSLVSGVVGDLLDSVRDRPLITRRVDLVALVRGAIAHVPRPSGVALSVDLPGELPAVAVDERRIRQVLTNLIVNALEALNGHGSVTVGASVEGTNLLLTIADDGPGIAPGDLPRLFEPLFTTKSQGTGLGLALSREIARAHGGDLLASNGANGGARFDLILPILPAGVERR